MSLYRRLGRLCRFLLVAMAAVMLAGAGARALPESPSGIDAAYATVARYSQALLHGDLDTVASMMETREVEAIGGREKLVEIFGGIVADARRTRNWPEAETINE